MAFFRVWIFFFPKGRKKTHFFFQFFYPPKRAAGRGRGAGDLSFVLGKNFFLFLILPNPHRILCYICINLFFFFFFFLRLCYFYTPSGVFLGPKKKKLFLIKKNFGVSSGGAVSQISIFINFLVVKRIKYFWFQFFTGRHPDKNL